MNNDKAFWIAIALVSVISLYMKPSWYPLYGAVSPPVAPNIIEVTRDSATIREFRKTHWCPGTGKYDGPCPGWVADHVWSLCLGGPDVVENIRWQSSVEAQLKDVFERDMCAMKRKLETK